MATQGELNLHDSVHKARLVNYFKIGLGQCLVCVGEIPVTVSLGRVFRSDRLY